MCGLFGIINKEESIFEKPMFNVLGINNDSRGGDSCGVFIDGNVEYGVKDEKLFIDFCSSSTLIKNTDKCKIALGHCRKASVGKITENEAQPVCIKNKDGKIEFVVLHNGTITNYKELAKKYIPEIDVTDMTDSYVMANIFYYTGYDVLGEYGGAGAFVIVDYRGNEPQIMFFKGESKYNNYSTTTSEERPLFFVATDKSFYFSSIRTFLFAYSDETVYFFPSNKLLLLNKEFHLVKLQEFDRSNCLQVEPQYYGGGSYWSSNNEYTGLFGLNHSSNNSKGSSNIISLPIKSSQNDKVPKDFESLENGLYLLGSNFVHGCITLTNDGKVISKSEKDKLLPYQYFNFFFWSGVLLYNFDCFKALLKASRDLGVTPEDFYEFFTEDVHKLSPDFFSESIVDGTATRPEFYYFNKGKLERATGRWQYLFSETQHQFCDGKLLSSIDVPYSKNSTFYDYKAMCSNKIDLNSLGLQF